MECATLRLVERRSEVRGKGAALDYALENMRRYIGDFRPDYVVVFDADNRVPVDFLDELSSRVGGHAALQCNVKTKNPNSSLIARASYYEGLILQRLWQHGKDRMGLCTALAGTGEAIRYDLISTLGFGNSLTDDLDLTIRLAERGLKVKYLHYPCTYDEKPDSLRVEIRRRTRWAAGHFQTFFRHGARLLSIPNRLSLDAFFYLTNIISPIVVLTSWFASALLSFGLAASSTMHPALLVVTSFVIFPLLIAVAFLEGDKDFIKNLPIFYAFMAIWFIAAPVGLAKALSGGMAWERTPHKFTSARVQAFRGVWSLLLPDQCLKRVREIELGSNARFFAGSNQLATSQPRSAAGWSTRPAGCLRPPKIGAYDPHCHYTPRRRSLNSLKSPTNRLPFFVFDLSLSK